MNSKKPSCSLDTDILGFLLHMPPLFSGNCVMNFDVPFILPIGQHQLAIQLQTTFSSDQEANKFGRNYFFSPLKCIRFPFQVSGSILPNCFPYFLQANFSFCFFRSFHCYIFFISTFSINVSCIIVDILC